VLAHLWTGKRPQAEEIELALIRLYGCRPSELHQEDPFVMLRHLTIVDAENFVENTRARNAAQ